MNNGPMLFLGLFAAMAISWVTFVLGPQAQMGNLQQARTVGGVAAPYPNNSPGLARQGAEVYRACGCVYCHTEQVRPKELGSDLAHGWGIRRSVAHDYIYDATVMLGTQRVGPDLANAGLRMDAMAVLVRLWDPRTINHLDAVHSIMPAYKYLFEVRKIGRTPSPEALGVAAPQGYEIVPRPAAWALAAYVANLRQEPYLFEAPPPPGSISTNTPAGGTNAPAGGTNAPAGGANAPAAGSGVPALPGGTNAAKP
ncbi:MAG: cbb3-type cytochrome c oxidase subunit II [Verrucomicrobiota bacterium]|jgi:cytochrome c oxidase cbb3-type subunit 2